MSLPPHRTPRLAPWATFFRPCGAWKGRIIGDGAPSSTGRHDRERRRRPLGDRAADQLAEAIDVGAAGEGALGEEVQRVLRGVQQEIARRLTNVRERLPRVLVAADRFDEDDAVVVDLDDVCRRCKPGCASNFARSPPRSDRNTKNQMTRKMTTHGRIGSRMRTGSGAPPRRCKTAPSPMIAAATGARAAPMRRKTRLPGPSASAAPAAPCPVRRASTPAWGRSTCPPCGSVGRRRTR